MVSLDLDMEGRLLRFSADTPSTHPSGAPAHPGRSPDWSPLFAVARLDPALLSPISPQSVPRVATDFQAAWTGSYAERPEVRLRIEAASFRDAIVFFEIVAPWTESGSLPADSSRWIGLVNLMVIATNLAVALCAYLNWKTGRADIRGAAKMGLFFFGLSLLLWAVASHHPDAATLLDGLVIGLPVRVAFGEGAFMFALYLAMEPWGRRLWPHAMITWSRVLTGRWRDQQVGRDILIGLLASIGFCLLFRLADFNLIRMRGAPATFSGIPNTENNFFYHLLIGHFSAITGMLHALLTGFGGALLLTAGLLVFRAFLRNKWLAAVPFIALIAPPGIYGHWTTALIHLLSALLVVWTIYRFGFFVWAVTQTGTAFILLILTTDFTAWYGALSLAAVVVVSIMALVGVRLSLLGRPLWGGITNPAAIDR
jgi:hypothetical protein